MEVVEKDESNWREKRDKRSRSRGEDAEDLEITREITRAVKRLKSH